MSAISQFFTKERLETVSKTITKKTYEYPLPALISSVVLLSLGFRNIKQAQGIISVGIGALQILGSCVSASRMITNFQTFKDLVVTDYKLLRVFVAESDKEKADKEKITLRGHKATLIEEAFKADKKDSQTTAAAKAAAKWKSRHAS